MSQDVDVRLIAATLAAGVIAKHDRGGIPAVDAVDIYLEILAALDQKAPNGRPKPATGQSSQRPAGEMKGYTTDPDETDRGYK